jgi:hypothetical protein
MTIDSTGLLQRQHQFRSGLMEITIDERYEFLYVASYHSAKVDITFDPGKRVCCLEIAFIQRGRRTHDNAVQAPLNPNYRPDAQGWAVDRAKEIGPGQPYYGYRGNNPTKYTKPGSNPPPVQAWMNDWPGFLLYPLGPGHVRYEFETSAVCKRGLQADEMYATVTWGLEAWYLLPITVLLPLEFR